MKSPLILLYLLFSTFAATAQQAGLTALLKKENVPGIQLIHTKNGHTTTYSLGLRQNGTTQPVTGQTIFQAASLGKVVLAYTALRLVDQGILRLDTPLFTYFNYPRLRGQARADKITARMVLGHTAGLPNWAQNPFAATWATSPLPLSYTPDSCWNYSGEGYVLLQKTLEHLTGKSVEVLAQEQVFGPLHMARSSFVWQKRFAANAAAGHDAMGRSTGSKQFVEANAGFSLLTTAADYNRFLQALLAGRGLQPATARLLSTAANPANRCRTPSTATDACIDWACGVGLAATSRGPALWHWGNNDDFQGFFLALPERRESLLFFTNSANGLTLTDELLRLFLGPGDYCTTQWLAEAK
ncbi:CubicO group peptidase, beta-lactamase class C family [Hymenobacter daecheongensis DSM 21074]|uniref:CubicO group peptidase, beta-lactamase class C family n=1 Tax=Hymenobacter daecheongensis DSM 21074 TaxID=1121955 RepID=A0A1M6KG80_9BACT|nr:serine hydrolase domain-containing protein [Hymenobacter daecheongensis]SHJ57900.1 CubicO group peptidase, beta-lactamase class C family [Hymenobacter daecheongensis DSM 21074]